MTIADTFIKVFCVDSSASMLGPTDFSEVNEESAGFSEQTHSPAHDESHNAMSLERSKDSLVAYECFEDMTAIIATISMPRKDWVTRKVLALLASLLRSEINARATALEDERRYPFGLAGSTRILESDLQTLKAFCAGLKVHEEALTQFMRFRASSVNPITAQRWAWSIGDPVPAVPGSTKIPILDHDITEVPNHLRCPISHNLMDDAVEASDGQTYSRGAIQRWFAIRGTSPLHGAPLNDLSLAVRPDVRGEVESWTLGAAVTDATDVITVTFDSRVGSFTRSLARTTNAKDLYRLAYRGLKAKFEAFQLSVHSFGTLPVSMDTDVSSIGLSDCDHITIRIPEDTDILRVVSHGSPKTEEDEITERCLVKVFEDPDMDKPLLGFWVPRDTTRTFASVFWKYWRYKLCTEGYLGPQKNEITLNVRDVGDDWYQTQVLKTTENLAAYLTQDHCTGHLGPEKVYSGDTNVLWSRSSHKVLKILIRKDVEVPWRQRLTRLDVLKQIFEALINRMLAYNYKNHVGLVQFSSHAEVVMPISHVLENFRRATNEMEGDGDTALWDALALAGDQVEQYASRFPGAKKRIVVISDGKDNKSTTNTSHGITSNLLRQEISVDSVSLGDDNNAELRTLSYLLGSYRFHPKSLTNALAICEMEPFLSLSERPPITIPTRNPAYSGLFEVQFLLSRPQATATLVTGDTVPPIRAHPNMEDEFVQLTDLASQRHATSARANASVSNVSERSRLRVPRLMNEIRSIAARGTHTKYDIYISTADVSFWKIVVEGPDGSPYSDGAFLLYLHADEGYPRLAPKARFLTKIKHPNVNSHGRICHSIFDRDWTSDTSMGAVLDTVYGLLYQPEHSDPVNTTTTLGFFHDPVEFAEDAREHVRKHASKTREEWKAEILGEQG